MSATDCSQKDDPDDNVSRKSDTDSLEEDKKVDSSLHGMRKGFFGRSAEFLQADDLGTGDKNLQTSQVNEESADISVTTQSKIESSSENGISQSQAVDEDLPNDSSFKGTCDNADLGEENNHFEFEQSLGKKKYVNVVEQTESSTSKTEETLVTSNVSVQSEESLMEIEGQQDANLAVEGTNPQSKKDDDNAKFESAEEKSSMDEGKLSDQESGAVSEENKMDVEDNMKQENKMETAENICQKNDEENKMDIAENTKPVDKTDEDGKGSSPEPHETSESGQDIGEEKSYQNNEKASSLVESGDERRKSLRARKSVMGLTNTQSESGINERRKSLRVPKTTPMTTVDAKSTPKKSLKRKRNIEQVSDKDEAEDFATTSARAERKSRGSGRNSSKTYPQKTPRKKRASQASEVDKDKDPYNIDNMDDHPEPLRNIQMERQSFGGYKFTKSPTKSSPSCYEKTEQTASAKRSNLPNLVSQHQSLYHKSLTDLATSSSPHRSGKKHTIGSKRKATDELFADVTETSEGYDVSCDNPEDKAKRKQLQITSASTPKKKRRESAQVASVKRTVKPSLLNLTACQQFDVDHRESEHIPYNQGARVYALWDKLHYAAVISADRDASGRYEVVFVEDGATRRLVSTGIIPICSLVADKKCLTANSKGGEELLEEVKILEMPSSSDKQLWSEGIFAVKNEEDEKIFTVPWQKLVIDLNQAKDLNLVTSNPVRDINAENIDSVEHRRTRAARHIASTTPIENKTLRAQGSSFRDRNKLANLDAEEPEKFSQIFEGITFVVTSAVRKVKEDEQGFSKREVRQLIEARGGQVVDDVSKSLNGEQMFLIADTHYRTHKYLSALARSIPCVSHQWIQECVKEDKLVDHNKFMLPAGISLLNGEVQPWHSKNGVLLKNKTVFLFSLNRYTDANMPNFKQIWSPLIEYMGAKIVDEMSSEVNIVLTDTSCTEELLIGAREANVPVVSSEWIIQSIIHGSLPEADAHERFKYDYVESVE